MNNQAEQSQFKELLNALISEYSLPEFTKTIAKRALIDNNYDGSGLNYPTIIN